MKYTLTMNANTQAPTIALTPAQEAAPAALRVVHSRTQSPEPQPPPAKEVPLRESRPPRPTEQPVVRTQPYWGRSYSADGPAGGYQGL